MKRMIALLGIGFVLITACMIYLLKSGISVRTASLIKPSIITGDQRLIARSVLLRLSLDFQNAHYVLWGVLPAASDSSELMNFLKEEHEHIFKTPVHVIENAETASAEDLRQCQKPCWLLLPRTGANELSHNEFIEKQVRPLQQPYFNVTHITFTRVGDVPETCIAQKRLSLDCLKIVSVHEAQRKMKEGVRYFFMRQYLEKDFFLFIQD